MTVTTNSLLALLVTAGLATSACAQASQEDLIAKREAKLASDWIKLADWVLDYDEARAKAKESGKPIFAYFTRSYSP
ncbi:MAG: thioredoxin domain-containing protein [Planctomycetota bacterium]|jgi:hypothetical protein